jgi:hypothetical protein
MKVFRILSAVLMVIVIVVGIAAIVAWRNQDRIIKLVLARVQAQTGYKIVPQSSRLAFRSHLVVLLEKPHIYFNGVEVAKVDDVRAVIAFHAIFTSNGLPLYAIAMDHPQVRIPASLAGVTTHGFVKPDVQVAKQVDWMLDAVSDITARIEVVDGALSDVDGTPLIDHVSLTAYRQHRGPGHWPWLVTFGVGWNHTPFNGAILTGRFKLGNPPSLFSKAKAVFVHTKASNGAPASVSTPGSAPTVAPNPATTSNIASGQAPAPTTGAGASPAAASPAVIAPQIASSGVATPAASPEPGASSPLEMISSGRLTFHGFQLAPFHGPYGIQATGELEGSMRYALRQDGILFADTVTNAKQLTLQGKPFMAPVPLGDLMLHAAYRASMARLEMKKFTVTKNGAILFTGGGSMDQRYENSRTASVHVEGVRVALTQLAAWLRTLRAMPPALNDLAHRFGAGQLELSELVFNPRTAVKDWSARTLRDELTIHSAIIGASFDPPPSMKLAPIRQAGVAIEYEGGLVTLTQGSANVGRSTISDLNGEIQTARAPALISYDFHSQGDLDVGEIYSGQADVLKAIKPELASRITSVGGTSSYELDASGKISNFKWTAPDDYSLKISPESVEIAIKGSPSPIAFTAGDVEVRPGEVAINHIIAAPTMPHSGNALLNGTIITDRAPPTVRDFTADLHEFRAETWLPLALDTHQFAAKGAVG